MATRRRSMQGVLFVAAGAVLILIALVRLLLPSIPATVTVQPSPNVTSSPPAPLSAVPGALATVVRVLGGTAGLSSPQEAVMLPGGGIAVADTGKHRLLIFDSAGSLIRSITRGAGALESPYALAVTQHALYLLDSARGAIEEYNDSGRFVAEILRGTTVRDARGLAVGPDGNLYLANPQTNSVAVISASGAVLRQFTSPIGAGSDQFNQPSDVSVSRDGIVYVVDNANNRIKLMSENGTLLNQLAAPPSVTVASVHVLPLKDGRLLASDPAGSVLLYPRDLASPVHVGVSLHGEPISDFSPLGLANGPANTMLVTDTRGNRILVVSLPH